VSRPNPIRELLLCYVTDRKALSDSPERARSLLLEKIASAGQCGVDWIQIREKDLSAHELAGLVEQALSRVPSSCRVLVNDRLDVAVAVGAAGVHLAERSLGVEEARRLARERDVTQGFQVGASTHSLEAVREAARAGADYVFFGPVFTTPSKAVFGSPQGIDQLRNACRSVTVPVIAIGGITQRNAKECLASGGRGVAAIRLFQEAKDMAALVEELRQM
jgi:thiamine-phosphate pyrophosphorylase